MRWPDLGTYRAGSSTQSQSDGSSPRPSSSRTPTHEESRWTPTATAAIHLHALPCGGYRECVPASLSHPSGQEVTSATPPMQALKRLHFPPNVDNRLEEKAMAETRRKFDQNFRDSAVHLVRETGKPIAQVARDLGIKESTLGNWVNADRRRHGSGDGQVTEHKRTELGRLHKATADIPLPAASPQDPNQMNEAVHDDANKPKTANGNRRVKGGRRALFLFIILVLAVFGGLICRSLAEPGKELPALANGPPQHLQVLVSDPRMSVQITALLLYWTHPPSEEIQLAWNTVNFPHSGYILITSNMQGVSPQTYFEGNWSGPFS